MQKIRETIKKFFEIRNAACKITYDDVRDRILPGYMYKVTSDKSFCITGNGGILIFIDACQKQGISPCTCMDNIHVFIRPNQNNDDNAIWVKLPDLVIKEQQNG